MRVLLDECLPRRLKRELSGHDVLTVPEAGWAGKRNGELLQLATGKFDAFVTVDQNLVSQQPPSTGQPTIVILTARSNRFNDLRPLVPQLIQTLASAQPGRVIHISS